MAYPSPRGAVASEALASSQAGYGASMVGVEERVGYTSEELQGLLDEILDAVDVRISGVKDNGGLPIEGFKYLNILGSASIAQNLGEESVDITFHGLTPPIPWSAGINLYAHQITSYLGSSYVVVNDRLPTSTPPSSDTTNYRLFAEKGATGAGAGGAHGSTHVGTASDPIPNVTSSASGLATPAMKATIDGLAGGHNHDADYLQADGSDLKVATSIGSPTTGNTRRNTSGNVLEFWDGDSWEPYAASLRSGFIVPKAQLADLDIGMGDLADGRSVVIHTTAAGKAALTAADVVEGQFLYETDTGLNWQNDAATGSPPSWGPLVDPISPGYTPPWVAQGGAGSLFGAYADGDPYIGNYAGDNQAPLIYAYYISTTKIKLARFRLPKNLSAATLYHYPITAFTAGTYRIGIYNMAGTKLYDSGNFAGTANVWNSLATGVLNLTANTDYWIALSTPVAAYNTYHYRGAKDHQTASAGVYAGAGPMRRGSLGLPTFASAPTTGGNLPASITVDAVYNFPVQAPSFPAFLIEGSAA